MITRASPRFAKTVAVGVYRDGISGKRIVDGLRFREKKPSTDNGFLYAMRLTYRYRLNPTKSQRTALNATLDACRWVYNNTLATRKEAWEQRQESVSKYDTVKMLPAWKAQHEGLQQAYSQTLQAVCNRVDLAFQSFFRRVKHGENQSGYPRFRGKGWYDSFTFPAGEGWKLEGDRLRIFKVGTVKIKLHRPIEGEIKTLTIRRDTLGNWYACCSCEVEWIAPHPSPHVVGIDMGLEKFAALSTGVMIDNPRFFRRDEHALAQAQRKPRALPKGTQARNKAKRVVQHITPVLPPAVRILLTTSVAILPMCFKSLSLRT